ncbi:MAG: NADH-quinone oxidoreductase subunit C [Candidatus Omnitrophica bacterium]|nr:NADH-quinone oxidoreductase subunit C [Candidatus Omnitrophota bacterium]
MDYREIISGIKNKLPDFNAISSSQSYPDEICLKVSPQIFKDTCFTLHKILSSPVMMLFALDERKERGCFVVNAVFVHPKSSQWIIVTIDIPQENPSFDTLAKSIYSASLFEREIWEMFGIKPEGNPDLRRLHLHDEVWPQGNFPLRKDFSKMNAGNLSEYKFGRVDGEGIFEVPVGPVHAGIIGPGHFRFSVAGEPIINLETRLGFTHRGVEKLFEDKICNNVVGFSECVSGDSSFAHSLAFTRAIEKISGVIIPKQAEYLRAIFLEFERIYNHANDIGGISIDVGFSFPAAYASIIKEAILQLNERLAGNRYLKKVNTVGGVLADIDEAKRLILLSSLKKIKKDFQELARMLNASVSFMDRADTAGVLKKKTAEDLGIVGLVARASGIPGDLRKYFPGVYKDAKFKMITQESGDVLARLKVRIFEFEESLRLIEEFSACLKPGEQVKVNALVRSGSALGYAEGWRGPVLYWLKTDPNGLIQRCKIVDPSFHNWQGLTYAVLGNIIPDFPLCNKSFDLSYSGNDL